MNMQGSIRKLKCQGTRRQSYNIMFRFQQFVSGIFYNKCVILDDYEEANVKCNLLSFILDHTWWLSFGISILTQVICALPQIMPDHDFCYWLIVFLRLLNWIALLYSLSPLFYYHKILSYNICKMYRWTEGIAYSILGQTRCIPEFLFTVVKHEMYMCSDYFSFI